MKLIYNTNLQIIEEGITYFHNINPLTDIRIELDSYELIESESLLTNLERILVFYSLNQDFDYNDLRKYLIHNIIPNWNELSEIDKGILISYYCVPNDYIWNVSESEINERLINSATPCRQARVDKGRAYINLHFKLNPTLGGLLYEDTKQMMVDFVTAKFPNLFLFINNPSTEEGIKTKPYYSIELVDKLNYILFR